jgi:Domain of unknown function (DUF4153)
MASSIWNETPEDPARVDSTPLPWPLRPVVLGAIGLAAGLLAHAITGTASTLSAWQASLLMGVALSAMLAGFTLERRLWWASLLFSAGVGIVGGAVIWSNGSPGGWSAGEMWRMVSLLLAAAIAAPLFQAARDQARLHTPYASVHDHAWTNVVLFGACWLFVGIVFAMAWLLATLFGLIKIEFVRELLEKDWFWRGLIGLAFGAGLGLLRENDRVVRLLQRVVATVLGVLAPALAVGLVLFLLALPFTGLQALWDATSATTPVLLSCAIGALILANAVIGNSAAEEKRFAPLRFGAMALAVTILPLGLLAATATGLRIGQYGYTPERLWGVVFVGIACFYGAAYLAALVRGRLRWGDPVRRANLMLAFVVCAVALVLATPIVSFNAIATRDQVARLESGKLSPEKFDWRALAFDFGAPGTAALARLKASANPAVRERAARAGRAENRWEVDQAMPSRADLASHLRVLPAGSPPLPDALLDRLAQFRCGDADEAECTVVVAGPAKVLVLRTFCFGDSYPMLCDDTMELSLANGRWEQPGDRMMLRKDDPAYKARVAARQKAYAAGQIDIRPVQRRQLFVGGQPVGVPFE